jgi:hypothetical protein
MKQIDRAGSLVAVTILAGSLVLAAPASAMSIIVTFDPSTINPAVPSDALVMSTFGAVAAQFDAAITNPITVNIDVSLGAVNGVALPAGQPSGSFDTKTAMGSSAAASFSNAETALANTGAVLPAANPTIGAGGSGAGAIFYMPQAEVKALALPSARYPTTQPYDGYIGFSSTANVFSFAGKPGSLQYSFQAAAKHEIEEVLGRTSFLNNGGTLYQNFATPMDLFRYTAPGVTSYTPNTPAGGKAAYASVDGGVTDLGTFADQTTGGDRTDWQTPTLSSSTDAQNADLNTGASEGLSISDEDVLKALGYTIDDSNGLFDSANAPVGASESVNAAPEPASLWLLLAGAGSVGLIRRMRRSAPARPAFS